MASARGYFNLSAHQRPNVGDTKTSVVGIDHMGWLKCDGRALQISDFKFLFDVIGYSFGSNTSNDFKLPSPEGRVVGYTGSGAGLTSRAMGSNFGTETHTLTIAEMPTHNHEITDPGHTHSYNSVAASLATTGGGPADNTELGNNTTGSNATGITINNRGGSNAHNNMQPTLFVGNLFIYSGKSSYGNNPFTAGVYVNATSSYGSNLV